MATLNPTTEPAAAAAASPEASAAKPAAACLEIDRLYDALVKLNGSDLHLKVGQPPSCV